MKDLIKKLLIHTVAGFIFSLAIWYFIYDPFSDILSSLPRIIFDIMMFIIMIIFIVLLWREWNVSRDMITLDNCIISIHYRGSKKKISWIEITDISGQIFMDIIINRDEILSNKLLSDIENYLTTNLDKNIIKRSGGTKKLINKVKWPE